MGHFQDIFTPPQSLTPEYNLREDVLNQICSMEDGERRDARARQFMNQFQHEQQQPMQQEQGAVGGDPQGYPPVNPPMNPQGFAQVNPLMNPLMNPANPPVNPANPANFQIVNEYNSFNLANITPPVAPR